MSKFSTHRFRSLASPRRNGNGHATPSPVAYEVALKALSDPAFFQYRGYLKRSETEPLTDAFTQVADVYACIVARARPIAMCPLKAFTKTKDGEYEEVKTSPFDALIYRPNPFTSRYQFLEGWEISVCRFGEAIIFLDRDRAGQIPRALWLLNPTMVRPILDARRLPVAWEYRPSSSEIYRYELWQICQDKLHNPDDPIRGLSPLTAAKLDIDQEWDVNRWNRSFLKNNCDPGGNYELSEGGAMDPEQANALFRHHRDRHQGPSRVGEPMISLGPLKYNRADIPHREMSFQEQRDFNLRAIKMVLGVPSVALGFEEEIPLAGARAQMRMFWTNTLIPRARSIEDALWSSLCSDVEGGRYEILFDLQEVEALRDDLTEKIPAVAPLWTAGAPMAEINRALSLGLEEWDGWDRSYVPVSAVPSDSAGEAHESSERGDEPGAKAADRVEFTDFTQSELAEAKNWDSQVLRPNEKKFHGKARSFFFDHRNLVLDAFAKATGWGKSGPAGENKSPDDAAPSFDPDSILPDPAKMIESFWGMTEPIYRNALLDGAAFGANLVGTEAQVTQIRGELARWLEENCLDKITMIEDNLREALRESIADGLRQGETLYQIAGRIKHIHKNAQNRSLTIARTEVARAANFGEQEEFKESGVVSGTRWNAAMDGATRPSHRALHRQIALLGEKFRSPVTGAELEYPGDPMAPPEEVCNCRCIATPILSED